MSIARAARLNVAVIIPFFQQSPGLLARAVRSVLNQDFGIPLIIIVDDGSPINAAEDLEVLCHAERAHTLLISQTNAGPGAARNRGLDALSDNIEYVAFLDSDDAWTTTHLATAISALEAGVDFYFTDHIRPNADHSMFKLAEFPDHECPEILPNVFEYQGDLFAILLRRSPIGTSTVVYRRTDIAEKFPTNFAYGEDVFFWMKQIKRCTRVAFSTTNGAIYGRGINIAADATWGRPNLQMRLHSEYRFHHAVRKRFTLNIDQKRWSNAYSAELFSTFIRHCIHLGLRRHRINWRHAAEMILIEMARRLRLL